MADASPSDEIWPMSLQSNMLRHIGILGMVSIYDSELQGVKVEPTSILCSGVLNFPGAQL